MKDNVSVAVLESGILSGECSYEKMRDSRSESVNFQAGVKVNSLSRHCEFAGVFVALWFSHNGNNC